MIPDNVEKIIMTKEDYDRNVEQLLVDKCKAELETERLHSIIKEVREYIDKWLFEAGGNGACMNYDDIVDILEILDKENNNE